ncbi:NADH-quinone oxidoreductase subunit NuoN [Bacillus sp. DNRA2]|uniref:NADH-quinone oxidoreductase subunit NuoN n=1 Tax=Bacillus sp. DNRA2 TaxID=2723053 RepID=UPI00145DB95D|nr:NADH-quinone oxidoreductase subunit NuoN [Bacillus sp. DNRA2]NMD70094.1 NADH-quinone oxidoreductase subunit NuoN [Bacillus sp. DNRA2]
MDLDTLLSFEWRIMAPEFIILIVATIMSLLDLFMPKSVDRRYLGWLGVAGILLAMVSLAGLFQLDVTSILYDTFRLDSFAKAFKLLMLGGAALVLILAISDDTKEGLEEYRGEYFYLFLTALLGAMIMSSSGDIITMFVGLELLSISSYILAGMKKKNLHSNESAMKYVVNGSIATAITMFGLSYVYGLTGSTNLMQVAGAVQAVADTQIVYLLGLAFFIVFVGLSFKLATAPFHMWAPDVYQGAPTPVTAFLSVVSKTAGFVLMARMFLFIFIRIPTSGAGSMPIFYQLQDYIAFLAGVTMVIGNVVALRQRNVKRLFAYSSIAHAGYLLVCFVTLQFMFNTLWYYLAAYLFMNLASFAIIGIVTRGQDSEDIKHFAGLYRRSPLLAVAMGISILSLAGFPGTAGFIGKLNIFMGALVDDPAHYVLASIMIAATVVSYVYYFGIMTQMFFRPAEGGVHAPKLKIPVGVAVVIVICVIGTLVLGVAPDTAYEFIDTQFKNFADFFQQ